MFEKLQPATDALRNVAAFVLHQLFHEPEPLPIQAASITVYSTPERPDTEPQANELKAA